MRVYACVTQQCCRLQASDVAIDDAYSTVVARTEHIIVLCGLGRGACCFEKQQRIPTVAIVLAIAATQPPIKCALRGIARSHVAAGTARRV